MLYEVITMNETETLLNVKGEIEQIILTGILPEQERNALLGELELILSFLEYNRIGDMSRRHRRALELLEGPATLISNRSTWPFGSPSVLYLYWREAGKLEEELSRITSYNVCYTKLLRHGNLLWICSVYWMCKWSVQIKLGRYRHQNLAVSMCTAITDGSV